MTFQRFPSPSSHLLLFLQLFLARILLSQETESGPLAPISITSQLAYSTARPCAAGCLIYNGIFVCGVHGGYHDLPVELGCGCNATNACLCSSDFASSATSYMSSCISEACGRSVDHWQGEVTSMLGLYEGYCATANAAVEASTTAVPASKSTTAILESDVATSLRASPSSAPTSPARAATASSSTIPTSTAGNKDAADDGDGLSRSDVVALAASLGVGIPSLLVAFATLWVMLKKRKIRHSAALLGPKPAWSSEHEMLEQSSQHRRYE
ncbi:hypothetical protein LTS18_006484 [Coniosporium uncinatum]|uniref:Uncharacterized protein n=1 Tax=Coniosporium uncinatum TaxID=93489 RepID=A0ACC3D3Y8_9PEZI|nr:hypothetical protein LTS18_006484 [Coniosporium uncinatum]